MGVKCVAISAACTVISFVGLQLWTEFSLEGLKTDGLLDENYIHPENASRAIELLLGSYATIGLLANFVLNVFVLLVLCLKAIFFVELYPSEGRKLTERLINYVVYKGTFLPLVVSPTIYQAGLWSTWLTVLCTFKMFQAMARDRLERLNASPSARPWTYFRVYSALLFVLCVDIVWIKFCLMLYRTMDSYMYLLLFFEPLSIAFETMQAILVHGFQLLDIWIHHSAWTRASCQRSKSSDSSPAGSLQEWKSVVIRNVGFSLDMAALLMALGHYVHIWWLHGMAFHLVDAVLFLNIRALLSAILKRVKGYIKLSKALGTLHAALPDATHEELHAYDDECAICREPMAKAKKLQCNHLFHLACLRSWLDQGLNDNYSCPTCRKPLFAGRAGTEPNPRSVEAGSDEQLARQISAGLNRQNPPGHTLPTGMFPTHTQNPLQGGVWRDAGSDSNWLRGWPSQSLDGAGPSTSMGSVGLGGVQMMMSRLGLEDASWSLWPTNTPQASSSGSLTPATASGRYAEGTGGLHIRNASRSANDNIANMLAMAETVREVLPHVPDEIIYQDLQRTNSVSVTVNNLLQM